MTAAQTFARSESVCSATVSFDAAQAILAAHAQPLGTERVRLTKAGHQAPGGWLFASTRWPMATISRSTRRAPGAI